MNPAELPRVLASLNPWWSGRPREIPEYRRLAYHECYQHLTNPDLRRAVLLSGPRRVGKTVILRQVASALVDDGIDPRSVLYLTLEHPLLKVFSLDTILRSYHQNVLPQGMPAYLLLDELHYAKEWDLWVKVWVDHHPEYRILATGSAASRLNAEAAESGVGRWVVEHIPTLSFYEFVRIRGGASAPRPFTPFKLLDMSSGDFAVLADQMRPLAPEFMQYMIRGGFPETALSDDLASVQKLLRDDVLDRVLKRDMAAFFNVRGVDDVERLFLYLCYHGNARVDVQACARSLGITRETVTNYLAMLVDAHLVYRLSPLSLGGKNILKAQHKYYIADAALRNAALLRGSELLNDPTELGITAETVIARHILGYNTSRFLDIGYWYDGDDEVDVVSRFDSEVLPFEIKFRNRAHRGPGTALMRLSRLEHCTRAYLVTRDDADFSLEPFNDGKSTLLRVPAHILAYLLGFREGNKT